MVVFNGRTGLKGTANIVVEKTSAGSIVALAADVEAFMLAELIESATGLDISSVPLFGPIVIPELKFTTAIDNITTPLLAELASKGSAIYEYKDGIPRGIAGRFIISIAGINNISVDFAHKCITFNIPDTATLSLKYFTLQYATHQRCSK